MPDHLPDSDMPSFEDWSTDNRKEPAQRSDEVWVYNGWVRPRLHEALLSMMRARFEFASAEEIVRAKTEGEVHSDDFTHEMLKEFGLTLTAMTDLSDFIADARLQQAYEEAKRGRPGAEVIRLAVSSAFCDGLMTGIRYQQTRQAEEVEKQES